MTFLKPKGIAEKAEEQEGEVRFLRAKLDKENVKTQIERTRRKRIAEIQRLTA